MPLNRLDFKGNWQEKIEFLKKHEAGLSDQTISMQDFAEACKNVRPSVPTEILKRYDDWMKLQGSG